MSYYTHPLLQPVVIQIVMGHVPKSEWRTCRMVCRSWYGELLPRWRNEMKVRVDGLEPTDDVPSFVQTCRLTNNLDFHQLEKYPMRLMKTISSQVVIKRSRTQRSFWKLCGHWLHELHFHGVVFKDLNYLNDIIFKLTPNLQKLEFSGCPVDKEMQKQFERNLTRYKPTTDVQSNLKVFKISSDRISAMSMYFPLDFVNLFTVFANLEELTLRDFKFNLKSIFDVIRTIREAQGEHLKLNIKKLHLQDTVMYPLLVSQLCAFSFPLEDLEVAINLNDDGLTRLLSQYTSLTKLAVRVPENYHEPHNRSPFQFHVLPQTLQELSLDGGVFEDWTFIAVIPNLTKLEVNLKRNVAIRFPRIFPMERTPLLEFVTTFTYCYDAYHEVIPAEDVKVLVEIMPNVTHLTLSVDCDGFQTVCNTWTTLKFWEMNCARVKETTFVANINKLTCLTNLDMNIYDEQLFGLGPEETKFGNHSIKCFLKLPKLQKLSTILSRAPLSETWLKKLYDKVYDTDNVYVICRKNFDSEDAICGFFEPYQKISLKKIIAEIF